MSYDPLNANGTTKIVMDRNRNFCMRCLQCLLAVTAGLLTLVGCCLIGTGIFVRLFEELERPLTIVAISIGAASIANGILGFVAIFTKRNVIHITFIVSACCALLASLVVGCWLFLQRNTFLDDSTGSLPIAIDTYFKDEKSKQFMDDVQNKLSCCGAKHGFSDYGQHSSEDPTSVCEMQFYGTPCHDSMVVYLTQKLFLVLGLTAVSAFLLVIMLVQFLVMFCIGSRSSVDETI